MLKSKFQRNKQFSTLTTENLIAKHTQLLFKWFVTAFHPLLWSVKAFM